MKQVRHPFFLLTLPFAAVFSLTYFTVARAQITPDNSLGAENSVVTPNVQINGTPSDRIDGGAIRGGNLFHSFQEFNINAGRGAYFSNPAGIANILTRVTGSNISNIQGVLGVLGGANLFLINPNGIIFGPNARLDVGGSFLGSTANSLIFNNNFEFSATNPQAPPLLTITAPVGLSYRENFKNITNQSRAVDNSGNFVGLTVPQGNSLTLVGGNVNLDGGILFAPGGRVELGGLSAPGTVGLNGDGSLSFPVGVQRGDVSLTNGAGVDVTSGGGGSIAVNARNLEMTGGSFLGAGIGEGLGTVGTQAGDISVNATGAINLNNSDIFNQVQSRANGQGGDVSISASSLRLEGGAQIGASTSAAGKGGNLRVDAQDVQLIGTSADGQFSSTLGASAEPNSTGNAGDLTIKTNTLLVRDGAQVSASTSGAGKGGSLRVDAQDVQLIGTSANGRVSSGLFARANSTGDAGDLSIKTNTLLVRDGAQVDASTSGAGKGGNLRVDAQDVQLIGTSANGRVSSGLFTQANSNSTGDAGDLTIKTNTLLVRDGAQVSASTSGAGKGGNLRVDAQDVQLIGISANGRVSSGLFAQANSNLTGDAGDLTIKTNTLLVRDGAVVGAGTFGAGKGGSLSVDAQDVQIIGTSADGQAASALGASAERNSTGDAGDLTIKTNTLLVRDGAQVGAATFGAGKGGSLSVDAQDVQLIGRSADRRASSGLFADAQRNSTGNAGDLTLRTNTLLVRDGALVSAGTYGAGKGGSLSVDAQDVQLIGTSADGQFSSGLFASTTPNSTGDAGDLTVRTNTLLVRDGAEITVESRGTGTAGKMTLNARSIRLNNNASLSANTQSAKVDPNREQATININSKDLIMTGNSNIRTDARGENVIGGNININTDVLVGFDNSDITANSANSRGGNVRIDTKGIFGFQSQNPPDPNTSDITATGVNSLLSGNVQINILNIDPSQGLFELTEAVIDPAQQIAQNVCIKGFGSSFTITGRGGLPTDPNKILSSDNVRVDLVKPVPSRVSSTSTTQKQPSQKPPVKEIIPAQGWIYNEKGEVLLVGYDPTKTGVQRKQPAPTSSCAAVK
ncbi:filamentous hemagglutinin N-terminal domain-containing protein [Scytonema tolypothrichoides VB-61278]|nr:filamentous hemagglutinin N-terminal domain-containing protein [Scytonema tolypothrichoides VB-61278]